MKCFFGARQASLLNHWPCPVYPSTKASQLGPIIRLRFYHGDGRQRLSNFWVPTGGIEPAKGSQEDTHALLIRAGFVRQAHTGLFQFLPLGLRVQEKLERLLDKHMIKLGASKLSLSTFSSEELWEKTGRLESSKTELFRFQDRKSAKYLLSPTHEEEITSLVGSLVKSYKELPLKLYQISRKYRDEPRPRQGLLRTREFLMKDLYTFDVGEKEAGDTYELVREAYEAFFNEFKLPYLIAQASSGEIGGDCSHEYHTPSSKGEDTVISCDSCGFTVNEELVGDLAIRESNPAIWQESDSAKIPCKIWAGIMKSRDTLVIAIYQNRVEARTGSEYFWRNSDINSFYIKHKFPDLDMSVEDPWAEFEKTPYSQRNVWRLYDYGLEPAEQALKIVDSPGYEKIKAQFDNQLGENDIILDNCDADLVKIDTGDTCIECKGTLKVQTSVELGHTFQLGTRYSEPLEATVAADLSQTNLNNTTKSASEPSSPPSRIPIQMGCHGIGVSRLIAAVADSLADSKGLNWPSVMAPFQAIVVPTKNQEAEAAGVYDLLTSRSRDNQDIDAILDDREKDFGWKLRDADMIGYPVIVIVGRDWKTEGKVEVQCRRLGVKEGVKAEGLRQFVETLLRKL